ncbi:MAG: HlyC/CorC family transporter [Alphaproteobacteria bacterium]|nr:HlyC/CorC family transporter [Alphaproteobacteria bacterium]
MVYLEIIVILVLTVMNGLLSMSEMALVSSRRSRLEHLAASGSRGARAALRLLDDQGSFLSTVQIGITLIGIFAGAFGGATLAGRLGGLLDTIPLVAPRGQTIAFPLVVVLITYLSLVVGELVPKRIALADPERTAAVMAPPMLFLAHFTAPAVWLLKGSTEALLTLLRMNRERASTITEEEVKSLVAEGTEAGVFEPAEKAMIEGVLRLADRPVRAIMTPRPDVVWLDVDDSPEAAGRILQDAGYSRLLVCQGAVDHAVGVVHTKTLLPRALRGEPISIAETMTPALVIPESAPVLALLERFRRGGVHMAVVVDEYGLTQGIVTPTDILEAISGTLAEQGEEKESPLVRRADGTFLVDGLMPIDAFEDGTGLRGLAGEGDFHTVAGFVLHRLGHLPTVGEAFDDRGVRFEVIDMDGRRIDKVLVQITPED